MVSMGKTIYYSCFILDRVGWVVAVLGNTMPRGLITFTSPPSPPILWWAQVISLKKEEEKLLLLLPVSRCSSPIWLNYSQKRCSFQSFYFPFARLYLTSEGFSLLKKRSRKKAVTDYWLLAWSPKKACVALMFTLEILRSKYQTNNWASIFLTEWADYYCIHSQKTLVMDNRNFVCGWLY